MSPNKSNDDGRTPLFLAIENMDEEVVEMLLGREDVNPNKSDKDGETPLLLAIDNRDEGVVEILLRRDDVNPNKLDKREADHLSGGLLSMDTREL